MENTTLLTGKKYIKDIFNPEQFYNIPEYQRPYVWGDEQILALLDDISKAMESDNKKEYFLGCMIWNTKKKKDKNGIEYECQDILDGQQRFITLFLLHGVLRDLSIDTDLKNDVQKRLVQEANKFSNIPSRNRIEFEIREDKDFLDSYIIKREGTDRESEILNILESNLYSYSIKNMAKGILTMRKWWASKLGEPIVADLYLAEFYTYLSTKVLALYLATPNNLDDAYNLFTVLNSRGLQLQVSDILRAQNLRQIDDDDLRRLYASQWSDFENAISAPYKGFDDFLWSLVFIKMKYRSDENKSLTKAFDFMFKRGLLNKGTETFDFVGKYVNHYEAITNGSISDPYAPNVFSNLNFILTSVFGSQYLAPLMFYRECFGEHRIVEFMIKIDNLFSISWLLGRRQSQTRIFVILRKMGTYYDSVKSDEITIQQATESLLNDSCLAYDFYDENYSTEKPIDINEFYHLLDKEKWGSFSGTRVNKTRYLLLKLDLLITSTNTQLQYNKESSSIEHLMPQNIRGTKWFINEDNHKEWVHRLGNLVLIDKNKNSSLSNKVYSDKRGKYQGAIETRANTNFVFINYVEWDINSIKANHDRVVSLLKQYYSGNSFKTFLEIKKKLNTYQPAQLSVL